MASKEEWADSRSFEGGFLLFRRTGRGLRRKYAGSPRFRHQTREAAETEAHRLLTTFPESTFVILQEVGRVKNVPVPAEQSGDTVIAAADWDGHASDCATHNEPALPNGACDCEAAAI